MRVGVVTPVLNGQDWIHETVGSVLRSMNQAPDSVELTYIVQDGGSTDATVYRAHEAIDSHASNRCDVVVVSESDRGMYDALARGFAEIGRRGGADWYAYLNAGDLWSANCLSMLQRAGMERRIDWLMGLHAYFGPDGTLVHTRLPFRYRQSLLRHGVYGRGLPTVQQESTFWRGTLHARIDIERLPGFRLAGDAYLWWSLAQYSEPHIVEALLGGFRYHGGHLGVDKADYEAEVESFAGAIPLAIRTQIPAERALWEQPARLKARFNPRLLKFDTATHSWATSDHSLRLLADSHG